MANILDTKRLRQKLLDLAVRGKLVPQDPNDEPASELLARIHSEKLEMVKRGELKPKDVKNDTVIYYASDGLPYEKRADGKGEATCIAEEVPFGLPEGWAWARLGELGSWKAGATPAKRHPEYYEGGSIPWLLTGDLNDGHITTVPRTITNKALHECSLRLNPPGTVLLAMYGATIGKTGILDIPATTNQACCACIPYTGSLRDWLVTWLQDYRPKFIELGFGGAQPNISREKIVSRLLPVPPLAEQRRIVAELDRCLSLVDTVERDGGELEALFRRLRSKVLDLAIRGELTERDPADEPAVELLARIHDEKLAMVGRGELKPKDVRGDTVIFTGSDGLRYEKRADGRGEPVCIEDEIPFEIPETWAWARLGGIVSVVSARRVHKDDWRKQGILFYRAREIVKLANGDAIENPLYIEKSLYEKLAKSGLPEPGDLMVTGVGTIGISYIVKPEDTFYYKDASVLCLKNRFGMLARYLQLLLGSGFFISQVHEASAGTTVDTITIKNATTFLLPVPPLAEQRRIVEKVETIFCQLR